MKLEKAIEIGEIFVKELDIPQRVEERAAIKLGIEALKRIKSHRQHSIQVDFRLLPGETKD